MTYLTITATEYAGYIASIFVMLSFTVKNIRMLRILNSVGCASFVLYGILNNWDVPIIITNVFIITINLYYLSKKAS